MSVYTVHEPPAGARGRSPPVERFIFVRDGFSFCAFLLAPLWMLWHRLWLVLLGYVMVWGAIELALVELGASRAVAAAVSLIVSLLVGLEASSLRRFTLWRRGWRNIAIVSGEDLEDAEQRFFDSWLAEPPASRPPFAPAAPAPALTARPVETKAPPRPDERRVQQAPAIIGLFPEPGGQR